MKHLGLMGAILPMLILIALSHQVFAYSDQKHCHGYSACYSIGYHDVYSDAQNGVSPAYACVGHSTVWCGYNDGFRGGNGGSNIFYGRRIDQSANINVHGDNNKISINQQSNNQVGYNGFTSLHSGGTLPNCVVLCLNSNIRIK